MLNFTCTFTTTFTSFITSLIISLIIIITSCFTTCFVTTITTVVITSIEMVGLASSRLAAHVVGRHSSLLVRRGASGSAGSLAPALASFGYAPYGRCLTASLVDSRSARPLGGCPVPPASIQNTTLYSHTCLVIIRTCRIITAALTSPRAPILAGAAFAALCPPIFPPLGACGFASVAAAPSRLRSQVRLPRTSTGKGA